MNQILAELLSCENQIDTFFVNQRINSLLNRLQKVDRRTFFLLTTDNHISVLEMSDP